MTPIYYIRITTIMTQWILIVLCQFSEPEICQTFIARMALRKTISGNARTAFVKMTLQIVSMQSTNLPRDFFLQKKWDVFEKTH